LGISVIIPIGENDESWRNLIDDLSFLSSNDEVVFSTGKRQIAEIESAFTDKKVVFRTRFVENSMGRARQMNAAVKVSAYGYLWFLHCDSRIPMGAFAKLKNIESLDLDDIHFFSLKFLADGPRQMAVNTVGVWFRSQVLKIPFGDQAFFMKKSVFQELGGFNEEAPYGEDHLLVWKAHRNKIKIRNVGSFIYTSARKYRSEGWSKTTSSHLILTVRQALPEIWKIIRTKENP